ncbi:MAG: DNA-binding protein [Sphingobacteriales bacterium]|nr:MAG: DNA-binding protein [Sphingobacteriales bacterium]
MQTFIIGLNANELLQRIEQLIDAKIGSQVQNKKEEQSDYITRKETADLLKITLPTLHDWCKVGYLKPYKIGARVLFKKSEVIATLEKVPSFKHKKGVYHG